MISFFVIPVCATSCIQDQGSIRHDSEFKVRPILVLSKEVLVVTEEQIQSFKEDGYLVCKSLFAPDEIETLQQIALADKWISGSATGRVDASGVSSRLCLSTKLDDDRMYSAIARSPRVVETVTALLGEEVYHYHHKMMLKEARVGGAWEWHQDYGYWYLKGCLYPDMASCLIAVDRATRENGCLQVLKGSHKIGRIEHATVGEQQGADMNRVSAAAERHELVYCELEPGDALFFHGNTLHRSDQNLSDHSRWSLICCYNTKHNSPYLDDPKSPRYTPLKMVTDEAVLDIGVRELRSIETHKSS